MGEGGAETPSFAFSFVGVADTPPPKSLPSAPDATVALRGAAPPPTVTAAERRAVPSIV